MAFEVAQQLRAQGQAVAMLALFEARTRRLTRGPTGSVFSSRSAGVGRRIMYARYCGWVPGSSCAT